MAEGLTKLTDLCIIVAVLWFAAIVILCTFELYSLYYFEIEAKDILNQRDGDLGDDLKNEN
jgi:hypothetical protein